ncbi:hypothetical protein TNCV_1895701 [Trichonephila clavipes]|nr:hypothetical protein TNCV_1895701 [Trichonephila clavipes]
MKHYDHFTSFKGNKITRIESQFRLNSLKRVSHQRRKQFNSPPQLENQSQCRRKTTQLVSRNETTELNRRKQLNSATGTKQLNRRKQLNSAAGTNNSTRQYERNNSTQQEKTTKLVSRNETTQLCTAVDRLQPPATAYNRLQPPAPSLQQNRLFLPTNDICV